jgi:hypothetical protein
MARNYCSLASAAERWAKEPQSLTIAFDESTRGIK